MVFASGALAFAALGQETTKLQQDPRVTAEKSTITFKAHELIGLPAQNKSGEKLGTVRDLAFAMPSGRLEYIVAASGGILGLGADYHALPAKALTPNSAARSLTIDATKEQWDSAPKFKKEQLGTLGAHREEIERHFPKAGDDLKLGARVGGAKAEIKGDAPEIPPSTGREKELRLATDLIGKQLTTSQGDDIGKVSDLLVDLKGAKVAFAIITAGTLLKPDDTRYAIATERLSPTGAREKLTTTLDRAVVEQAQPFDVAQWEATGKTSGSAGVFKYQDRSASLKTGAQAETDEGADASANATALALMKEGNRYVGEQARNQLVQMRSEKASTAAGPSVWYIVYYDPTAALKATEVKFVNGQMTEVKRPLRLLEATSTKSEPLDREKIKIDSDKALALALKQPALENTKVTACEMRLERGEAGIPVWKIQLWSAKAGDTTDDASLGHTTLSAEDGKVLKNDLKAP